ncbi:major Facilitator Superfamily protein [Yersinia pestis 1522]|nr:major Facilitator Superfamily protein [Yersinia pestis 1412]AKS76838.1 major Facilitator Superfamily protein [Yersinia pestis 1413]AKS82221.1 major Facilitator Superfamily protein [Yersinia pestis 1522]AKS88522.1 major Facilitator Superfamily protein [Yersinia pestis 8787]AKS94198.1 major Facilitator Superfamily protein [Yersinia pestis 3770]AKS96676.1 major Facilitator Superfamily protein [Yersinia pestis 3067]ETO50053.1 fosmidomycin resistance protein [Yersinia pestis 9]KNC58444.1 major
MTDRSDTGCQQPVNVSVKRTSFSILGAISVSHLLNDMIQSLILAIYPLLQAEFSLSFAQIGLITLTYQLTASLLQPLIGLYTDKHPQPYSLPIGMGFTLSGILLLAVATTFPVVLLAAALVGTGSSVFHPESSRVARMASGGRHGLAQSVFQVGGILAAHSVRYWPPSLLPLTVKAMWAGFRSQPYWQLSCCCR